MHHKVLFTANRVHAQYDSMTYELGRSKKLTSDQLRMDRFLVLSWTLESALDQGQCLSIDGSCKDIEASGHECCPLLPHKPLIHFSSSSREPWQA